MNGGELALRQAIEWHLRLAEGDVDLWHAFTDWIEADETHASAYERVALDDRLLDDRPIDRSATHAPLGTAATMGRRAAVARWGTGIAAVLVGAIGLHSYLRTPASAPYLITAPAAGGRSVTLEDGTQIALNAGARLRLDRAAPRHAVLESGEALFQVRHDADHPFRVEAADRTIEDLGTTFDVAIRGRSLHLAVAEGSVAFHTAVDQIVLKPGMAISAGEGDEVEMRHVDPATIGGWRAGHVDFDNVPLADVAEQLRLSNGIVIAVAPDLAGRPFSGVLRSDRGADEMVQSLAQLSGARATRGTGGWALGPDSKR